MSETLKHIATLSHVDAGCHTLMNALNGIYFDNSSYQSAKNKDIHARKHFENISTFYLNDISDFYKKINEIEYPISLVLINCKDDIIKDTYQLLDLFNEIDKKDIVKILVYTKTDFQKPNINKKHIIEKYNVKSIFETSCIEGIGIQELRDSINNEFLSYEQNKGKSIVTIAIEKLSASLCELVAKNPNLLLDVEWRDLERIIAICLAGIGFSVELTPASNDGGKDVIAYCRINNNTLRFFIEIKHWIKKGKVGAKDITSFVEVNINEKTSGGLFLSTSGYSDSVYRSLNSISKQRIKIGDKNKIVTLCKRYLTTKAGVIYPQSILPQILFEESV